MGFFEGKEKMVVVTNNNYAIYCYSVYNNWGEQRFIPVYLFIVLIFLIKFIIFEDYFFESVQMMFI